MVNPRRIIEMARKWQKVAALGRRRVFLADGRTGSRSTSVARKGHFTVYTRDGKRFVIPIAYLNSSMFRELLQIAEEFGLPGDHPIILPIDAVFMEQVVAALRDAGASPPWLRLH